MPAKSEKQRRYAACSADEKCRKKLRKKGKKPMPMKVAKEYRRQKHG